MAVDRSAPQYAFYDVRGMTRFGPSTVPSFKIGKLSNIERKKVVTPGPADYEPEKHDFARQRSPSYTMPGRSSRALSQKSNLPAPNTYAPDICKMKACTCTLVKHSFGTRWAEPGAAKREPKVAFYSPSNLNVYKRKTPQYTIPKAVRLVSTPSPAPSRVGDKKKRPESVPTQTTIPNTPAFSFGIKWNPKARSLVTDNEYKLIRPKTHS